MSAETNFIILIIAGLICGFIDSFLGMGYGITSVTVLITFGIAPAVASASIHTAEAFVDIISAASHWKLGNVEKDKVIILLISGIPGAVLGAIGLSYLAIKFAVPFVSIVLLILGISILCRFITNWKAKEDVPPQRKRYSKRHLGFLGFIAGFIDTSGGGGWGPILTSTFVATGSHPSKSVGTVEFTEPIISLAAVITFGFTLGFEEFLWPIVIPMVIGGIILTPIAAYLCKKVPYKLLGILIGLWVIIFNARTLIITLLAD
jgi:uncharacterized membrane protein YfcA